MSKVPTTKVEPLKLTASELALPWPKWVPVPDSVGAGRLYDERGEPVCALGWARRSFGFTTCEVYTPERRLMLDLYRRAYKAANHCRYIPGHNDCTLRSDRARARAHRRALEALGYIHIVPA